MANNNQNDIVVSAQANTKQAEANLQKLDAQVKSMTASDPKLQQFNKSLGSIGSTVISQEKAINGGFSALQGNLNGVITKLGAAGLAVAALKKAWDSYWAAEQKTVESMKAAADASGKYFSTLQDSTNSILKHLGELDKLAEGGYLDDSSIQKTNNLVSQLNDLWGDVGITVDQTTGKVNGLADATKKITEEMRDMAIRQAKLEEQAAQAALNKANSDYDWYFDENGEVTGLGAAALTVDADNLGQAAAGMATGTLKEQAANIRRRKKEELEGAKAMAEANLLAAQQKRIALEGGTTDNDISTITNGAAAQPQANAAKAAEDAEKERQRLMEEEDRAYEEEQKRLAAQTEYIEQARKNIAKFDAEEERLKQELATAQANGGDVEGAKAALDNYIEQRSKARLAELQGQLPDARAEQREAQRRYNQDVEIGADDDVIEASLRRLEAANERIAQITGEMGRLASGVYKPAEAPATETAKTMKAMASGTFDAFGLHGLGQNTIEQQQLDVQKKIAKNTENLNVPIVGE